MRSLTKRRWQVLFQHERSIAGVELSAVDLPVQTGAARQQFLSWLSHNQRKPFGGIADRPRAAQLRCQRPARLASMRGINCEPSLLYQLSSGVHCCDMRRPAMRCAAGIDGGHLIRRPFSVREPRRHFLCMPHRGMPRQTEA